MNLQEARVCETLFDNCIIAKSHKTWLGCRVVIVYELYLMSATSDWAELNIQLLVAPLVKNPPANAGDTRDAGSIPGSGRSPGAGHGRPLQCSCLEDLMVRGAWWVMVRRAAKSWARLKWLSMHTGGIQLQFSLMIFLVFPFYLLWFSGMSLERLILSE